jgi:hypothetical protein
VFVHSLWSLTPLPLDVVRGRLLAELTDFQHPAANQGFDLFRSVRTINIGLEDAWTTYSTETVVDHLLAVYIIDTRSGFPATGTIVGAVSDLPEANSTVMDQVIASTGGHIIQPDLRRDRVFDELDVYEARVVDDSSERSITYSNPGEARVRYSVDWADNQPLTAATALHEDGSLLTAFTDGQIWLEGVQPADVSQAMKKTFGKLWPQE